MKMEKQLINKPFLGGYRSQQTGIEYHNASAQTYSKIKQYNGVMITEHLATCICIKDTIN